MFSKILVPCDGSDPSGRALAFACDVAKLYGSELILLHVVAEAGERDELRQLSMEDADDASIPAGASSPPLPGILASMTGVGMDEESMRKLIASVRRSILDPACYIAKQAGVMVTQAYVDGGKPSYRVLENAERGDVDLIVMGRKGKGSIGDRLMGSVSETVAHRAACSCMLIN